MQISKLESKALEQLKDMKIFRLVDLIELLSLTQTQAYNLIKSLKLKRIITKIRQGLYAITGTDEMLIANRMSWPSYISLWTALNYYGLTEQVPKKIFSITTRYIKNKGSFQFITVKTNRFFGYTKVGEITIAEPEKAVIDSLLFPNYAGGIKEVSKCLENPKLFDKNKLFDYALKIQSKAVLRRLSYLLDSKGIKVPANIRGMIGKGYELLDPTLKKKNNYNKEWLLDINI